MVNIQIQVTDKFYNGRARYTVIILQLATK